MNVSVRAIRAADAEQIRALLRRASVFEPHEITVAEELIDASLAGSSDYACLVAEAALGRVVGYVCYGHNPVTDALHDVYWIAVDPAAQRMGVGRALVLHTEAAVRAASGRGIVIETSNRPPYEAARRLYEVCGFRCVAEVPDFYKPGDALVMYLKHLLDRPMVKA